MQDGSDLSTDCVALRHQRGVGHAVDQTLGDGPGHGVDGVGADLVSIGVLGQSGACIGIVALVVGIAPQDGTICSRVM